MVVSSSSLPFVSVVDSGSAYVVAALVGEGTVAARSSATGRRASAPVAPTALGEVLLVDLDLAPWGPEVLAVVPADGAQSVARDTRVTLTFSEALDAASLAGAVTLAAGGVAVSSPRRAGGDVRYGLKPPHLP